MNTNRHSSKQPLSLPGADPRSDRFRCGGHESNGLAKQENGVKRLSLLFAVASATALFGTTWAGDEQAAVLPRLELDLVDGSHIVGTPIIATVPVRTSYAKMDIPLAQIHTIKMGDDHETVFVDLQNGDKLTGVITLGPIELATVFGKVAVGIQHIRKFDVVLGGGTGRKGLVLWNRLASESDVRNSRVGPGGTLNAGRFVEGRFGKGIELNMQEQFGVTFPPAIVPGPDGCIEFWAKLVDFPASLPWGDRPGLIAACDKDGSAGFMLHFNGNDGATNGGLCARVAGLGCAGTAQYGDWTYARALGSDAVGDWHHYALTWATDGIPGVADGTRKAAVFVDGRLNSGYWGGGTGKTLTVPTKGRFGLLCHQGVTSGRIVYDNLKIWKFAKTDFSDRNDE